MIVSFRVHTFAISLSPIQIQWRVQGKYLEGVSAYTLVWTRIKGDRRLQIVD